MDVTSLARTAAQGHIQTPENQKLRDASVSLEASFLAEMLKAAGFGDTRESFGGGAGEDHFSSFMVDAHAKAMAANGGIGLAQSIYEALKERANEEDQ